MRKTDLVLVAAILLACSRKSAPGAYSERTVENAHDQRARDPASSIEELKESAYPPGRWRLVAPNELFKVLIPMSHILIRHEGVDEGIVSFQLTDWRPSPRPPARTREEARVLAEQISIRLQESPNEFTATALEVSEDIATQPLGGALGTRTAAEFHRTPEVLDALAAIRSGEVSRPVETQYGFHIFRRNAVPEEENVSGARILIAHDQAPWLGMFLSRRPLPARSGDDAMRLAQLIYERAKKGESFEDMAREYSDHREAVRGGDFGTWSTHERTPFPREIRVLAGMDIGEVHPPFDSPFGVTILKRTPNVSRRSLAMTTVQQGFNPRAPEGDASSRNWVLKNVRALSHEIGQDASRFAAQQEHYCCRRVEQWVEGRGEAEAEAVLSRLRVGEIAGEPVALAAAFGVIKRVEPAPVVPLNFEFELPAPSNPDLGYLASSGRLSVLLRGFGAECARALELEPELSSQFNAILDRMVKVGEADRKEREEQFTRLQDDAMKMLGTSRFERYLALLNAHLEAFLLNEESSQRKGSRTALPLSALPSPNEPKR